jgi:hypothetical protein
MRRVEVSQVVLEELDRASQKFPSFHSLHEGYAIILEELEELKAEIFKHVEDRDRNRICKEAVQVAAMAQRFLVDLC